VEPVGRLSEQYAAPQLRAAVGGTERLVVRGVCKSWNGVRFPILDSIELALEPGRLVSLVGANGAGKTTLLRIVAGLISPDTGTVVVDGLSPRSQRREYHRRIGFLTAGQSGLYARFSVQDHLEYWARIAFVPRRERRKAVDRTLRRFGLERMSTQRADRLSMGQRQRVRLAMTFLHDPSLVLLDEPHTSLDPDGLELLHEAVSTFVERGGTGIWCAPAAAEVHVSVDAALVLADGRLTQS
jgi:ABC-2 type transport system ATP-binding protein